MEASSLEGVRSRGHWLRRRLKAPLVEEWVLGEKEFRRVFLEGFGLFLFFNLIA